MTAILLIPVDTATAANFNASWTRYIFGHSLQADLSDSVGSLFLLSSFLQASGMFGLGLLYVPENHKHPSFRDKYYCAQNILKIPDLP